jgi:hypothetical protein
MTSLQTDLPVLKKVLFSLLLLVLFFQEPGAMAKENPSEPRRFRREIIKILGLKDGFVSNVMIQSVARKNNQDFFITYSNLEIIRINSIKLFNEKKNKYKKYRPPGITDFHTPTQEFYNSDKTKHFRLPENVPFQISFERYDPEPMFFSRLNFDSQYTIDTFYYEIYVPAALHLYYKFSGTDQLNYLKLDSLKEGGSMKYSLVCVPGKKRKYQADEEESNVVRDFCGMRMLITPVEFMGRETRYFNDWLIARIKPVTSLEAPAMKFADSITAGLSDKDSIARVLFDFVRKKIKYIDVEIGYGAFIPHDVNKILQLKQGDCKDKSNLLCQFLNYKGIQSHLAMTATAGSSFETDFPSLSSGNHMICVIGSKQEDVFLDPTEEFSVYGHTGSMTQGRMCLILDENGGRFARISQYSAPENLEHFTYKLMLSNDSIFGSFSFSFRGIPLQELKSTFVRITSGEKINFAKEYLMALAKNAYYDRVTLTEAGDSLYFSGSIRLSGHVLTRNDSIAYISLDFIPRPMEFAKEDPLSGDIALSHTICRKAEVSFERTGSMKNALLKPVSYDENGFLFSMGSSSDTGNIRVYYSFSYSDVGIRKEESAAYRKLATIISKSFGNAIKIW